jgi:ATP-binding cassette, subfamily A (ABC1), member 3
LKTYLRSNIRIQRFSESDATEAIITTAITEPIHAMANFLTAVKALVAKNLRYLLLRRFLLVFVVAFAVPIAVGTILSFGQSLFSKEPAKGTGSPHVVQTLKQSLGAAIDSGKSRIFLINNGMAGGDIDRVFDRLERAVETTGTGMQVFRRENDDNLTRECESSAQGTTACYGSIIMLSSPSEGESRLWNYSIRTDAALTYATASVDSANNAAQVYFLPFQKAVDGIISTIDEDNPSSDPLGTIEEFPFSYSSQEEWDNQSYSANEYVGLFESILGMAWVIPMAIITFHVAGFIAGERESGMSQLIDAMSSTRTPLISQVARIAANYLSFVMIYAPSWVIMAITIKIGLLKHSNFGIVFLAQILGGLALTSWGVFFGSLFKKSQWSGISAFILAMAFAIVAQMIFSVTTADVIVLSLLFTPSGLVYYFTSLASYESSSTDADGNESVDITQGIDRLNSRGAVYTVTPILIIIFFIIQIFGYLALALLAERLRHGTASPGRRVLPESEASSTLGESAVRVEGFSKVYKPGFF